MAGMSIEVFEIVLAINKLMEKLVEEDLTEWCPVNGEYLNLAECVTDKWNYWNDYDNENTEYEIDTNVKSFWTPILKEYFKSGRVVEIETLSDRCENRLRTCDAFSQKIYDALSVANVDSTIKLHSSFPQIVEEYMAYFQKKLYRDWLNQ